MDVEKFKLLILKQLKDLSSPIHYYLSDGLEELSDGSNLIPKDISLYASEFGLRLDFFYRSDWGLSREIKQYCDVIFVEAFHKGELDISPPIENLVIFEEWVDFDKGGISFGLKAYEIPCEGYVFRKKEMIYEGENTCAMANTYFSFDSLSFNKNVGKAFEALQTFKFSTKMVKRLRYLFYHFSPKDVRALESLLMVHGEPINKKAETVLLALSKIETAPKRGIRGLYEALKNARFSKKQS